MYMSSELAYGHWGWVAFNSIAWVLLMFVFLRPRRLREIGAWCLFAVFMVDEFTELYGAPYTLNHFSEQLAGYTRFDMLPHRAGDLWRVLFDHGDQPSTFDFYHIGGGVFIFTGFGLVAYAWLKLSESRMRRIPATSGPYNWLRHPQYLGLISIMVGYMLQGPTFLTLALLPLVSGAYLILARCEERELLAEYGSVYRRYMYCVRGFFPSSRRR